VCIVQIPQTTPQFKPPDHTVSSPLFQQGNGYKNPAMTDMTIEIT